MSTQCDTDFLSTAANRCEAVLEAALPAADEAPQRLHQAMRHAVLAGGKRVRPALVLAACRAAGGQDAACEPAMAAIELLHTYTLVHDDLPAMDDDDLRRGQPTCHVVYGEATAILVGDALQTLAFELLADLGGDAVRCLAQAAGSRGVVGGQQDDLDAEGLAIDRGHEGQARLERIHRGKTAALIRASCELGGIAAGADASTLATLRTVGEAGGLAFQIIDDILDTSATASELGKTPGKDVATGKWTYPAIHGLDAARAEAEQLRHEANQALAALGPAAADLRTVAHFIVDRSFSPRTPLHRRLGTWSKRLVSSTTNQRLAQRRGPFSPSGRRERCSSRQTASSGCRQRWQPIIRALGPIVPNRGAQWRLNRENGLRVHDETTVYC